MQNRVFQFVSDDSGAITVDWTVLSAAAVGVAIATTGIMTGTIDVLAGRMDDELRSRQLSDEWIGFLPVHFEDITQTGYITDEQIGEVWPALDQMMNHDVITALEEAIIGIENDTLTTDEIIAAVGLASLAYQRNIVDDAVIEHYFGFGSDDTPMYMTLTNAPNSSMDPYTGQNNTI